AIGDVARALCYGSFGVPEMTPLGGAFLAARARRGGAESPPASADDSPEQLEATLGALLVTGAAAHPELTLPGEAFAAHLGRCGAPVAASIHAGDLYLAAAALAGDQAAVAKLRRAHRPVIAGYLRNIDTSTPFVDEVEQRLWGGVLVGTADSEPKL